MNASRVYAYTAALIGSLLTAVSSAFSSLANAAEPQQQSQSLPTATHTVKQADSVVIDNGNGDRAICTISLIGRHWATTAKHCFHHDNNVGMAVRNPDNNAVLGRVVKQSPNQDIVLFRISDNVITTGHVGAPVGVSHVHKGNHVAKMGQTTGRDPNTVVDVDRDEKIIYMHNITQSGDSGGPLLDRFGNVLGVLFGGTEHDGIRCDVYTPIESILPHLP